MPDLLDTYNVVHAGYYMEIFAFISKHITQNPAFTLENHAFLSPLFMLNDTSVKIHVVLNKTPEDAYEYNFYSQVGDQKNWAHHARGILQFNTHPPVLVDDIDVIKEKSLSCETAETLYARITAMGMPAGESIRWTKQCRSEERRVGKECRL